MSAGGAHARWSGDRARQLGRSRFVVFMVGDLILDPTGYAPLAFAALDQRPTVSADLSPSSAMTNLRDRAALWMIAPKRRARDAVSASSPIQPPLESSVPPGSPRISISRGPSKTAAISPPVSGSGDYLLGDWVAGRGNCG